MSDVRALETAADPEAHPRRWVILGVLCTSLLLVMQGNTALNLALPKIAGDIGLSSSARSCCSTESLVAVMVATKKKRSPRIALSRRNGS